MLLESILAISITLNVWHILLAITVLSFVALISIGSHLDGGIGDTFAGAFLLLLWIIVNLIMWLIFFIIV